MGKLQIRQTGEKASIVCGMGSIENVLSANIPTQLTEQVLDATDYAYGYELASPEGRSSLGEAVVVAGKCYCTSTNSGSPQYGQVLYGQNFHTGGMFFIPHEAKPSHVVKATEDLDFEEMLQEIYAALERSFAFVGLIHFTTFHGIAIAKPPIDGRPIFDHKDEYFAHLPVKRTGVDGFVIGVVAKRVKGLEVVLYHNPLDVKSSLVHHTHVLTLKRPLEKMIEIDPDVVDQCLHLFVDGSRVSSVDLKVYVIDRIECKE